MRGMNRMWAARTGDERGVIAPMAALLMTAVLGMAAFALDTAMMYSEKAQLQNGADAAALAIALTCATDPYSALCQQQKVAASPEANGNALDGVSYFFTPKLDEKNGIVDVEVQTRDTAGNKYFSPVFGRVFGIDEVDIRAKAQAKFEGYRSAQVLPLTFSQCAYDPTNTTKLQFFEVTTPASKTACQSKTASKAFIPGGFGWLVHTVNGGNCSLQVTVDSYYKADSITGNAVPADCKTKFQEFQNLLEAGKTVEVLVPIYDDLMGNGANGEYHIEAFAQISLRGWQFSSGSSYLTPEAAAMPTPSGNGLFGRFVKKVTVYEAAVLGGPATYMPVIRLSN